MKLKEDYNNNYRIKKDEYYIRINYPDDYLNIKQVSGRFWKEQVYLYLHDLPGIPKCATCGKELKFNPKRTPAYPTYCSLKCANSNKNKKQKTIQTCLKKYGVENPFANEDVKKTIRKTCLKKYGTEIASQSNIVKQHVIENNLKKYGVGHTASLPSVKAKIEKSIVKNWGSKKNWIKNVMDSTHATNLERYGDPLYNNREKYKKTCLERYGVDHVFKAEEIKEKLRKTCIEKYGYYSKQIAKAAQTYPDFISSDGTSWKMKCPHPECNKCSEKFYTTKCQIYYSRNKIGAEQCTKIHPIALNISSEEIMIKSWLDEYNIEYIENCRDIIPPLELDIYIPSKNIAIECNGIYWHSTENKNKKYHIDKFIKCQEKGIQLLSIWEDQIKNKPNIVKSLILSKLGIYKERIYARKCTIKKVNSKESNIFLNQNHLQGKINSSIRYGLYYKDELISLMTFNKRRVGYGGKFKEGQYELSRFCNKLNMQVIGGASKLQKQFIRDYNPDSILSWSSNDISNGHLYKSLGYICSGNIQESYWYINCDNHRYHRYTFSKINIQKKGWAPDAENWTEQEVMRTKGFYQIYDSGTQRWELPLNIHP